MTSDRVPQEVADLLREHVQTHEQLETLVWCSREGGPVSEAGLTAALGIAAPAAAETLHHLATCGVLDRVSDNPPLYACSPAHAELLRRLGEVYRDDRVQLMTLMTSNALDRVRTSALRAFSRAFLLGKKK
jgi:hypothetical protein